MAVPDRHGDDAGEPVQILLSLFVPQVLHAAFDQQQRIFIESQQTRREILLPQGQHFVAAGAFVRRGFMVRNGERSMSLRSH